MPRTVTLYCTSLVMDALSVLCVGDVFTVSIYHGLIKCDLKAGDLVRWQQIAPEEESATGYFYLSRFEGCDHVKSKKLHGYNCSFELISVEPLPDLSRSRA